MSTHASVRPDPEIAALIPPHPARERAYLESSVRNYGCQEPLAVWGRTLLDGHERLQVCRQLGRPFQTRAVELPSRPAALLWVEENQFGRPDLTADQRAVIATRVLQRRFELFGRHWSERQSATDLPLPDGHPGPRVFGVEAMAEQIGVSAYRLRAAAELARTAPTLLKKVTAGQLALQRASAEVVARRRQAEREAIAEQVKRLPPTVRAGDFRKVFADLPDNSVDLIFTDPPYDKGSVPLYGALAELAARVLVPGGSLICYAGVHSLPALFPIMTPHLRYWWQLCLRLKAAFPRQHGWRVHVHYKPLLWFVKGVYRGPYMVDVIESTWLDKNWHDWQQSEAEAAHCISRLTPTDGLVLDPMCGSGTTLLAAARLGRRHLGADMDRTQAKVAAARLRGLTG